MEAKFRNNVEKILHMSKVRCKLVTLMVTKLPGKLECDSCRTFEFVVHDVLHVNSR